MTVYNGVSTKGPYGRLLNDWMTSVHCMEFVSSGCIVQKLSIEVHSLLYMLCLQVSPYISTRKVFANPDFEFDVSVYTLTPS